MRCRTAPSGIVLCMSSSCLFQSKLGPVVYSPPKRLYASIQSWCAQPEANHSIQYSFNWATMSVRNVQLRGAWTFALTSESRVVYIIFKSILHLTGTPRPEYIHTHMITGCKMDSNAHLDSLQRHLHVCKNIQNFLPLTLKSSFLYWQGGNELFIRLEYLIDKHRYKTFTYAQTPHVAEVDIIS